MTAAAHLIKTLDTAFLEMSTLSASAARDAEDARRNAREASEVARRYTARSYAGEFEYERETTSLSPTRRQQQSNTTTMNENDHVETTEEGRNGTHHHDTTSHHYYGGRKRNLVSTTDNNNKVQSSSERLARSHAEDVLALSLELERTKQALENERMAHDETRSNLTQARAKNTQLSTQMEKFQEMQQQERLEYTQKEDSLKQEIQQHQKRVEAAEEDAQLALDLAKGNADSREQLEVWLQRALQEVQALRQQLERVGGGGGVYAYGGGASAAILPATEHYSSNDGESTSKRKPSVRFAESPTVLEMPTVNGENNNKLVDNTNYTPSSLSSPRRAAQVSRSMVAAGRHLLHRTTNATSGSDDDDECKVHAISQTPKSAERREQLRQRLLALENNTVDDIVSSTPTSAGAASTSNALVVGRSTTTTSSKVADASVTRLLRECGQRLGIMQTRMDNNAHVESVARQFCNTVEVRWIDFMCWSATL